ncbi:hypothetical protein JQC92_00095 [Shewanella sp. 202IG2-18]|uniref:hypothetical protein n=1 Tax=Parashewanella hymeniacidonis TaxID=2807618 RepID=UPI0019620823|nr:hypothetical protein [Parashewanella hymeniacidonis]MBM7070454.1 hypothetical protein [Parashewanella hymeniacidonis]
MTTITLQSHSNSHFNPEIISRTHGTNFTTLEQLAKKASQSGSWTKFKIQTSPNGETKKFRVKLTRDSNGHFTATVQRNNWKAFFNRCIGRTYYDPTATRVEVSEKVQAANDLFANYATTLARINSDTTAHAASDFLNFREAGSDLRVKSGDGFNAVIRPSVYINERFKDESDERTLLVLDLDNTLSLERSSADDSLKNDNLESLDSGIKLALKTFKRNRPNGQVFLVTNSREGKEGKIDDKLAKCGLNRSDFEEVYAPDEVEGEIPSPRRNKNSSLNGIIFGFRLNTLNNNSPERIVFCDNETYYLEKVEEICKNRDVSFEGVQVHSARPYMAVKSFQGDEMENSEISEQEAYDVMSASEKHNHLMLTHKFDWA